jgi:hypothetical protein
VEIRDLGQALDELGVGGRSAGRWLVGAWLLRHRPGSLPHRRERGIRRPYPSQPHTRRNVRKPSGAATTFVGPMEASEQSEQEQLSVDEGGSVRALDDRLVIESLTVNDDRRRAPFGG